MIDGFNVYYSVTTCLNRGNIARGKWFDYRGYCEWVTATNPIFQFNSTVNRVRLYSAMAYHDPDPTVVSRHLVLNQAMAATNVEVTLGNFKRKKVRCKLPACGQKFVTHEEKETDINVAMGVIESLLVDDVDCVVIVSGDTDLVAAVREARTFFPVKTGWGLASGLQTKQRIKKSH
ncbi:MAG: NYN domain-containing protein [Cyanobacteria bacterium SZAS TMP-1]|nr:NYN domain-containing protein [Cyanobacteria bacterium SZAS TMP-1]